jgi:transitional endoplasmic reticulum ATPase
VQQRVLATLLNEMDGLDTNEETVVIVVAATNRLDMLDEALVRPGRFDNLLFVPPPQTIEEVLAVLRVHSRSMRLDGDVDLAAVARKCVGMSGAQLERVCREAGMEALRENLNIESVGAKHFQAAVASNGDD